MHFRVEKVPNNPDTRLHCKYVDLKGNSKIRSCQIPCLDEINYPSTVARYRQRMEQEIKEELGCQALEIRQQETTMATIEPYYYTHQVWSGTTNDSTDALAYSSISQTYQTYSIHTHSNNTLTYNSLLDTMRVLDNEIEIEIPLGKRVIAIKKAPNEGKIKITDEDIVKAVQNRIDEFKFNIITRRAERKAEDLLKSFISEVDFRNYTEKGYFVVKSGNKVYRIHKDKSRWVDMWEQKGEIIIPKNRLCTHTETRELPMADEVLSKLMLIRSGLIEQHSNLHPIDEDCIRLAKSQELILTGIN